MGVVLLMEEILRSPVEVGSLPHYVQGFFTSQVVFSPDFWLPSTTYGKCMDGNESPTFRESLKLQSMIA